ncbi:MAG: hypothetical protein GF317_09795 [Candidatus Lokiarchaeota archaeon]|nr:hypothetical protein [Candidatus Lokiarchaeota archaeon]
MIYYIFMRGNIDGICAAALYLRHINTEKYKIISCENFQLKDSLKNISKREKDISIILINLDANLASEELHNLSELYSIIIFTDKTISFSNKKNISVISDPDKSTCRIIHNWLENQEIILNDFDIYLTIIADLGDRKRHFREFPESTEIQVKNLSSALTLNPYDNEFRKRVLNEFIKGIPIKEIDEIRIKAVTVKYLTDRIFDLSRLHKKLEGNNIVIYEYNENDIVIFNGVEYKMRGRFSYLTKQLAIINKKICFILIHKPDEKEGCYIVMRKHNNIKMSLLEIAKLLKKYLISKCKMNEKDITYNGNPFAASMNINVDINHIGLNDFIN